MKVITCFITFVTLSSFYNTEGNEDGCYLNIATSLHEPLILSIERKILYSPYIEKNGTVIIACPGSSLPFGTLLELATCVSGTIFSINAEVMDLNNVSCNERVKEVARYASTNNCPVNSKEIEIGYEFPDFFLRQIQICFDERIANTLYSYSTLVPKTQDNVNRIERNHNFKTDHFYDFPAVNKKFKFNEQQDTINRLLGLPTGDKSYVGNTTNYFLSRGHLSPNGDLPYTFQEEATYHLVNTAPQWQTFNGANWNEIEESVRDLAKENNLIFEVYTGTFNVSTFPNKNGIATPIFLYVEGDKKELPVPQFYWKVVLHRESAKGVAIIGLNNPFTENVSSQIFCPDVSKQLQWLKFKNAHPRGLIFACTIDQFKQVVPNLPEFKVSGLLL